MSLDQSNTIQSKESMPLTDTCTRCHGFLIHVDFMDMLQGGYLWKSGKRCINCGWITDHVIQTNQHRRQATPTSRTKKDRLKPKPVAA